jgi:hypothetical protein
MGDVSRAAKGTKSTMISKAIMLSEIIVAVMCSEVRSLLQQCDPTITSVHIVATVCSDNALKDAIDRHGRARKVVFAHARA